MNKKETSTSTAKKPTKITQKSRNIKDSSKSQKSNEKNTVSKSLNSKISNSKNIKIKLENDNITKKATNEIKSFKKPLQTKANTNQNKKIISRKIKSEKQEINTENALEGSPVQRVRSRSRTLSPSEIKLVRGPEDILILENKPNEQNKITIEQNSPIQSETQKSPKQSETQKSPKQSETQKSPKQSETQKSPKQSETQKSPQQLEFQNSPDQSLENSYEDDFDSYESDFEKYSESEKSSEETSSSTSISNREFSISDTSSSEISSNKKEISKKIEENMLDSGTYDIPSNILTPTYLKNKPKVLKPLNDEHATELPTSHETSLDEGFEENLNKKSNLIDFASAKVRNRKKEMIDKIKKRGDDILNMISLDIMKIDILDILPVPYDVYMKSYGKYGHVQTSTQTNEDNYNEEVQTEEIIYKNKWSQHPIKFDKNSKDPINNFNKNKNGCGDEDIETESINFKKHLNYKEDSLAKFLNRCGKRMLLCLKNEQTLSYKFLATKHHLPFSLSLAKINFNHLDFLSRRKILNTQYDCVNKLLLTLHENAELNFDNKNGFAQSLICIWNLFDLSTPQKLLNVHNEISSFCIGTNYLIFAGLADGNICAWNLSEPDEYHNYLKDSTGTNWLLRSPTYISIDLSKKNNENLSEIVSIKCLSIFDNEESVIYGKNSHSQEVYSLKRNGILTKWSVVTCKKFLSATAGLAPWGEVKLVSSVTIDLKELNLSDEGALVCYSFQFDSYDPNHIYVSTNLGCIIHCLQNSLKTNPKVYTFKLDNKSSTLCLESFPFKQSYFLSGCEDGGVRLFSRDNERALITLYNTEKSMDLNYSIKLIKWSIWRPCQLFVVDANNNIHLWNLELSDIFPIYSIQYKSSINSIEFFVNQNKGYLIIGTDSDIELHEIHPDFNRKTQTEQLKELTKFIFYVNLL